MSRWTQELPALKGRLNTGSDLRKSLEVLNTVDFESPTFATRFEDLAGGKAAGRPLPKRIMLVIMCLRSVVSNGCKSSLKCPVIGKSRSRSVK